MSGPRLPPGWTATPLTEAQVAALLAPHARRVLRDPNRIDAWARVLWLRHCATPPATYREIGADLGVTLERVRQIEAKALQLLRTWPCLRLAATALPAGTALRLAAFRGDDPPPRWAWHEASVLPPGAWMWRALPVRDWVALIFPKRHRDTLAALAEAAGRLDHADS